MDELLDTNNTPPPTYYKRILAVNMVILAFYTLIAYAPNGGGALSDAFFVAGHVAICFIVGIGAAIASNNDVARGFFLSAGLVLLIGFGTCIGLADLFPNRGGGFH